MTRPSQRRTLSIAAAALLLLPPSLTAAGCTADDPLNPSFPLQTRQARAELVEMRDQPVMPPRPVVVIGGLFDVGVAAADLGDRLREHLHPDTPLIVVHAFGTASTDAAADRLLAAVEEAWPSGDPSATTEVDVVAFSYGGVIARHAARPRENGGRVLRIARLFTVASPHRGARMAAAPTLDRRIWEIRAGSDFLTALAEHDEDATYEAYAYVRLGDSVVGPENAGLGGEPAYWVAPLRNEPAHVTAYKDPRILADIARRLRNEPAYTTRPPAPIPDRPFSSENAPEPVLTEP